MIEEKKEYDALKEFIKTLDTYMRVFGLEPVDIASLSQATRKHIESLLSNNSSLELPKMEAIAQIFNLHYYEFGNPNQPIPKKASLPERTQRRINFRKESGEYIPESKSSTTINAKITLALSLLDKDDKFLTIDIVNQINNIDADNTLTTSLVGDRLAKSFSKNVTKTDEQAEVKKAGAKPFYFIVMKNITQEVLSEAVNEVGAHWFNELKKGFKK